MGQGSTGRTTHVGTGHARNHWSFVLPCGMYNCFRRGMVAHPSNQAGIPKPEEHKDIEELTHELNLE